MKAASSSRKTLVFIVNLWKIVAIKQLPCIFSCRQRERERAEREPSRAASTTVSKMAQQRLMLMCYNAVVIRTSGPWTLSRHLGLPEEPASNIPPASHQAAAADRRKRLPAGALGGGAAQPPRGSCRSMEETRDLFMEETVRSGRLLVDPAVQAPRCCWSPSKTLAKTTSGGGSTKVPNIVKMSLVLLLLESQSSNI